MTAADRLAQIEARADATPGQVWRLVHETPTAEEAIVIGDARAFLAGIEFQHEDDPDPTFIEPEYLPESYHRFAVHARADVPWLIEQVRKRDAALRAVLDLHKPMRIYEHEDSCEDESEEHREERHVESIESNGEYYCLDLPTGITLCAECSRDLDFDGRDYPCPTVRAVEAALGEVAS